MVYVVLFVAIVIAIAYLWYTYNARLRAVELSVARLFMQPTGQAKAATPQTAKPVPTSKA